MTLKPIETSLGWAIEGDNLFRGHVVGEQLIGTRFWRQLSLAMNGPDLSEVELEMLDCVCSTMLIADPRIWPLKVAWLSASHGSAAAGFSAAQVYFDHAKVGPPPTAAMAQILCDLNASCDGSSETDEDLQRWWFQMRQGGGRVPGFGVAGRQVDERIEQVRSSARRLGLADRPYARLQLRLKAVVKALSQLEENVAGVYAATFLDLGFGPEHVKGLMMVLTMTSLWGSAWESAQRQPALLQCLPNEQVRYIGAGLRTSPRQQASGRRG